MNLTNASSIIAESHELFIYALQGRYMMGQQPGKTMTPRDIRSIELAASKSRDALQARVSDDVREMVETLAATVDPTVGEVLRGLGDNFLLNLNAILASNVETLVKNMKVGRSALGDMLTRGATGAIGQLVQSRATSIEFKVSDTAGRQWYATRLVSFMAREMAYRMKLAKQIADLPTDLASVFNPDHDEDGLVFSATGKTPGYPTFEELRQSVFHPNSTAEVSQHVAP